MKRKASSKSKSKYKLENWTEYNQSLCQRGSLTLWLDQEVIDNWYVGAGVGSKGGRFLYSDKVIECALALRSIYHLPLRQTTGLLRSLLQIFGRNDLSIPCYSTLCRRAKFLEIDLACTSAPKHIVIDSTGLKVFGEGEWKVRSHGVGKRRTWVKIHLAIDAETHQITGAITSTNNIHDSEVFVDLLKQNDAPEAVYADGAYDTKGCYDYLQKIGAKAKIPPRKGAKISKHGNSAGEPLLRDENIREVRKIGRKKWKEQTNYHRRSLAETGMYRIKRLFGARVSSRTFETQSTEIFMRCRVMNVFTQIGMPESKRLAA